MYTMMGLIIGLTPLLLALPVAAAKGGGGDVGHEYVIIGKST